MEPTSEGRQKAWPMIVLGGAVVCLGGTAVGWFFGWLSAFLYSLDPSGRLDLGAISGETGALSGLAAGLIWCFLMSMGARARMANDRWATVILLGGLWGSIVGAGSATAVHITLTCFFGGEVGYRVFTGICFGVPVGLVVGAAFGAVWALFLKASMFGESG